MYIMNRHRILMEKGSAFGVYIHVYIYFLFMIGLLRRRMDGTQIESLNR